MGCLSISCPYINCHGVRWYFVNKNNVSNNNFVVVPFIQLYIDFNLKSTWFPIDHWMLFSHWLPLNGDDPSGPNYRPASRSSERGRNPGRLALPQKWEIRGLSHYQIGHFLVRSRKFSKHSEICVELSNRSRILQESVEYCYQGTWQVAMWCDSNFQSRGFKISRDLTIRRHIETAL